MPVVAYVMRHFDTETGADPGLTDVGQQRAQALAERLRDAGIGGIYVTATRRARDSVAPIAARLGLECTVYDPADPDALVAAIRARKVTALIVGHSNTVAGIVARLGGTPPLAVSHAQFGDLWEVGMDGTTNRSLVE